MSLCFSFGLLSARPFKLVLRFARVERLEVKVRDRLFRRSVRRPILDYEALGLLDPGNGRGALAAVARGRALAISACRVGVGA